MSFILHDILTGGVTAQNSLGTIAVGSGGTNASNAADARTNLGITFANTAGSVSLIAQTGQLPGTTGISGLVSTANLASGTATDAKFLKGDQTWAFPVAGSVAAQDITGSVSLITQTGLLPGATGISGLVATASLGTGSATASKFLKGDQTYDYPVAWPIGAVFVSVVNTNPSTLLGYGTWATFAVGRTLIGFDTSDTDFNAAEKTGGAKTVTLTSNEMPSHTHTQDSHNHTQNAHNHAMTDLRGATTGGTTTGFGGIVAGSDTSSTVTAWSMPNATATNQVATATNQNTGGGAAHANVPPFFVVYFWKRTA